MARYSNYVGGWFKIWGKQWLKDEKLKAIGDAGELAYFRILCYANSLLQQGVFMDNMDNPLSPEHICQATRISPEQFNTLMENDLIIKEDGYFMVKNWSKHQNKNVTAKHKKRPKVNESEDDSLHL